MYAIRSYYVRFEERASRARAEKGADQVHAQDLLMSDQFLPCFSFSGSHESLIPPLLQAARPLLRRRTSVEMLEADVITSYSIHYTKLYDVISAGESIFLPFI